MKVDQIRKIIVGVLIGLVVIVLGYSLLYSLNWLPSFGDESKPYIVLERELQTDPIVVEEFFSFSCNHCRNFDPLILDWAEDLPEGVVFKQTHVAYVRTDEILAKSHLVLEARNAVEENRERIFSEIHDRQNPFLTVNAVADFVDGYGLSGEAFMTLYSGDRITRLMENKQEHVQDVQVLSVPFVVIGNKYGVRVLQGRREAVNTIDYIVEELLAGREPPSLEDPIEVETTSDEDGESQSEQNHEEGATDDASLDPTEHTEATVELGESETTETPTEAIQASNETQ